MLSVSVSHESQVRPLICAPAGRMLMLSGCAVAARSVRRAGASRSASAADVDRDAVANHAALGVVDGIGGLVFEDHAFPAGLEEKPAQAAVDAARLAAAFARAAERHDLSL